MSLFWRRCRVLLQTPAARVTLTILLLICLLRRREVQQRRQLQVPRIAPTRIAHALADFNNHRKLHLELGSWQLTRDTRDATAWSYSVRYECGPRCAGAADVRASEPHRLRTDAASELHVVRVEHERCRTLLPLLPWPQVCDEWSTEWRVTGDGANGTQLSTVTSRQVAAVWSWSDGPGEEALAHLPALLRVATR